MGWPCADWPGRALRQAAVWPMGGRGRTSICIRGRCRHRLRAGRSCMRTVCSRRLCLELAARSPSALDGGLHLSCFKPGRARRTNMFPRCNACLDDQLPTHAERPHHVLSSYSHSERTRAMDGHGKPLQLSASLPSGPSARPSDPAPAAD